MTVSAGELICIVGPTASGKSDTAAQLALWLKAIHGRNAEIISADSRQVYRGLNIGSGKITAAEMHGVPHYMLDVVDVEKTYTVSDYKREGAQCIQDILKRGNIPIICGGTGFYIDALVENISLPNVLPDQAFRDSIANVSTSQLAANLAQADPERARTIDIHNRPRLIRALEIVRAIGKVPMLSAAPQYDALYIGISIDNAELTQRIHDRLVARLQSGMIEEVEQLVHAGVSYKRLEELGLEYRFIAYFLQKKLSRENLISQLEREIVRYAKRQKTWFKRNTRIHWMKRIDTETIHSVVENFLKK
jgi:tRNA dimethylallyltransferase